MGENSRKHAIEKVQSGDSAHQNAMNEMMKMSQEEQRKWYKNFVDNFDNLEDA